MTAKPALGKHLAGKEDADRILVAQRVGQILSVDDLPAAERLAAEGLARELVRDAIERVRVTLSDAVKSAKFLPRDVALKIAHDVDAVACPFLEVTEIFSDRDWRQLVMTISRGARIAVARRTSMSEGLSLALAEVGDSVIADVLVGNQAAPMAPTVCYTLMDLFVDSSWILDRLAEREGLTEEVVAKLIVKVSAAARQKLTATYGLPDHIAPVVTESELRALQDLIREVPESSLTVLAKRLGREHKLTPLFLLTMLKEEGFPFFEAALSVLAGARLERVRTVVRHEGSEAAAKLLQRGSIPAPMHKEFWDAIQSARD